MRKNSYNLALALICCIVLIMVTVQHLFVLDDNIYYLGNAISWVLAMLAILMLIQGRTRKLIAGYALTLTIINLVHEVLGTGTEFSQWQYFIHIIAIFTFVLLIGIHPKKKTDTA